MSYQATYGRHAIDAACLHPNSPYGRCERCGLTWDEQDRQATLEAAIRQRAPKVRRRIEERPAVLAVATRLLAGMSAL